MLKHADDLRDHAARDGRRGADAARARQALGARTRSPRASRELGYRARGRGARRAFARFKALADRTKHVTDADLEALVARRARRAPTSASRSTGCRSAAARWACRPRRCACAAPTATSRVHAAVGTGPVDAAYKAIDAIVARAGDAARVLGALGDRGHRRARRGQRARPAERVRRCTRSATARRVFHGARRRHRHHRRERARPTCARSIACSRRAAHRVRRRPTEELPSR